MSGSILKIIAVISMIMDHVAAYVLTKYPACTQPLCTVVDEDISVIWIMRAVGRLAFPIFCFLLVEGFINTRNRIRYGILLLVFAILSEIPFDLVTADRVDWTYQNVFFSLLFGYLGMSILEHFKEDRFNRAAGMIMLICMVVFSRCDYGMGGFIFIMIMYLLKQYHWPKMILACCFIPNGWLAMISAIPLRFYNKERGFIQGKYLKYCFYAFYPIHLLIIYLLQ